MDVVSGIVFSNRALERRSKSADKKQRHSDENRPSGVVVFAMKLLDGILPVSYTHLTLPTILLV